MKKTIREWYKELPPQIRKEALKNTANDTLREKTECLSQSIQSAFLWENTSQGHEFWERVMKIAEYFENN